MANLLSRALEDFSPSLMQQHQTRDQHFPLAPDAGQCQSVPCPACQSKAGTEPPLLSSDPKIHKEIQRFGMTMDAAE